MNMNEWTRRRRILSFLKEIKKNSSLLENKDITPKDSINTEIKLNWLLSLLKQEKLSDLILSNLNLKYIDLSTVDFTNTRFYKVTLEGCNLSGCNFTNTFFNECRIYNCELDGSNYKEASFKKSYMERSL